VPPRRVEMALAMMKELDTYALATSPR
jgi:hypothetical protein